MKTLLLLSTIATSALFSNLSDYFAPFTPAIDNSETISGVDHIYLINLKERPDRLEQVRLKFEPYGIQLDPFPAIYGWNLSLGDIDDIGLSYQEGMLADRWVWRYTSDGKEGPKSDFLRPELAGKTCFSVNMNRGALGCTLSHLSVLQHALDAGYETIWVLEDDITVAQDPHILSALVKELDELVGKGGWDILYTDGDQMDRIWYEGSNDFESDLEGHLAFYWRPDMHQGDIDRIRKRERLGDHFVRIGGRMHAHSMIIRRSGMEKILAFEKANSPFCPYDNELALVPGLKFINLREDVVTVPPTSSDTRVDRFSKRARWKALSEEIAQKVQTLSGWRNPQKALKLAEFTKKIEPELVVEIGAFGGATTYPLARTLAFLEKGHLYAIDAWDKEEALKGIRWSKDRQWWEKIDYSSIYFSFQNLLFGNGLELVCTPIPKTSQEAAEQFTNQTIDLLIIDGNPSAEGSFQDVSSYLPKVKKGGYIWLTEANDPEKHEAVKRLLKACRWVKEESLGSQFALFQKEI